MSPTAGPEHAGRHERAVAPSGIDARHHRAALAATRRLIESDEAMHLAAQSIAEFWAVATRPVAQNGLGLDVVSTASAIVEIERTFEVLLSDEAMVYPHWKRLVVEQRVTGRRIFDARLVAVMLSHGIARPVDV